MERQRWHAVYTKPRWEKKVARLFTEKGITCYCPLNRVKRKWSDRLKTVEEPLFKSYVFVKISEKELTPVRMIDGVVNFVYWLGKPAIIREREIETIQKFLNEYTQVEAIPVNLQPESKIRIKQGILMDKEGVVKKLNGKKVQVMIESIGYSLVAYIDRSNITLLENKTGSNLKTNK